MCVRVRVCVQEQEGSAWGRTKGGEVLRWPVSQEAEGLSRLAFPRVGPATDQTPQLFSSPHLAGLVKDTRLGTEPIILGPERGQQPVRCAGRPSQAAHCQVMNRQPSGFSPHTLLPQCALFPRAPAFRSRPSPTGHS